MNNPKVFISYSQDNEEHKAWVLKLATNLRTHGVNAILDQWDLRLGNDLRFFMEQGLSSASLVLCVCSENYVNKVNNGNGGAGYEGMIMTQDLLSNANLDYIIPIIRNNSSNKKTPLAFGSRLYIDFTDDTEYFTNYQSLLERIYGEDITRKPPLGENPFDGSVARKISIKTEIENAQYISPSLSDKVVFRFDNNGGQYRLGTGKYSFDTRWSRAGNDSIHVYGKIGYKHDSFEYPTIDKIEEYNFSSGTRTIKKDSVFVVQNQHGHFCAIKLGKVKSSNHGFPYDEMEFEYLILTDLKQEN